jgi:undecaprenyl pyrophosphate phosphatase UppP
MPSPSSSSLAPILSVVCLYWKRFFQMRNREEVNEKLRLYGLLIVGVLPAVVIGLLAKKSGLLAGCSTSVTVVAVDAGGGRRFHAVLRQDIQSRERSTRG